MIKADNYKHSEITQLIISAFYKVYNTLGYGFLEKVYVNALLINYLKATELEVGLLLNFGKEPEIKRKVFSNKTYHIKS
ncbi:MAG: GxxExxY protein [Bacteroidetes bacterium]|nr:GxxExxY protein [Bacteroidota bacterium]